MSYKLNDRLTINHLRTSKAAFIYVGLPNTTGWRNFKAFIFHKDNPIIC